MSTQGMDTPIVECNGMTTIGCFVKKFRELAQNGDESEKKELLYCLDGIFENSYTSEECKYLFDLINLSFYELYRAIEVWVKESKEKPNVSSIEFSTYHSIGSNTASIDIRKGNRRDRNVSNSLVSIEINGTDYHRRGVQILIDHKPYMQGGENNLIDLINDIFNKISIGITKDLRIATVLTYYTTIFVILFEMDIDTCQSIAKLEFSAELPARLYGW